MMTVVNITLPIKLTKEERSILNTYFPKMEINVEYGDSLYLKFNVENENDIGNVFDVVKIIEQKIGKKVLL